VGTDIRPTEAETRIKVGIVGTGIYEVGLPQGFEFLIDIPLAVIAEIDATAEVIELLLDLAADLILDTLESGHVDEH
jgi:hypothetical protein